MLSNSRRWFFVPLILVGVLLLGRWLDLRVLLMQAQEVVHRSGSFGPFLFVGIYALATVAMLPGSGLTLAGGALFGSLWGVVWVLAGATLGASLAFLIARYALRQKLRQRFSTHPKFQQLESLSQKHGAIIVAVTRLVPLFPFNFLNYAFGLTGVSFQVYFFGSLVFMIPGTVLYVVGSDAVVQTLRGGTVPWGLLGILGVTLVVLLLLATRAKKFLGGKN